MGHTRSLFIIVTIVVILTACSPKAPPSYQPGSNTRADVMARGPEDAKTTPKLYGDVKHYTYDSDGCVYQFDQSSVTLAAYHCPPKRAEVSLQYWRHKFKGQAPLFEPIPFESDGHGHRYYRLLSKQDGVAIIYDDSSDTVMGILRYDSR